MCQLLGVCRSGFYKWRDRQAAGPSARARRNEGLLVKIRQFHADSEGVNGAPRITADLREDGEVVSGKTVAKLMRKNQIRGIKIGRASCRERVENQAVDRGEDKK